MTELQEAIKIWEEKGKHGTKEERIERGKKWLPYYAYLAGKNKGADFHLPEKPDELVSALISEGGIKPGDSILDIGAGMGSYALRFAQAGCNVTAIDASLPCLELLSERASACGLDDRIRTACTSWEEFETEEHFDMVFTSMCPAICNYDELMRMESKAKKACCIITTARGSYDRHRKAMMAALDIHPSGGMVTEALHYMNVLYLSGRELQIKSRSIKSNSKISKERLLEQFPIYFKIFGINEDVSIPFLGEYFKSNAKDGYLEDESLMNLAMLYWSLK